MLFSYQAAVIVWPIVIKAVKFYLHSKKLLVYIIDTV